MADNVPAVQALGQCIFLPMLIIGGVAVPLESLPDWAQHVSAFFPGRYAVEALRAYGHGRGPGATRFSLLALLLIGAAGCLAGARLFRWDAQQRFAAIEGEALGGGRARGVGGGRRGRGSAPQDGVAIRDRSTPSIRATGLPAPVVAAPPQAPAPTPVPLPVPGPPPAPLPRRRAVPPASRGSGARARRTTSAAGILCRSHHLDASARRLLLRPARRRPSGRQPQRRCALPPAKPAPPEWRKTTLADIDREIDFTRFPPDAGVVTPIAPDTRSRTPRSPSRSRRCALALPDWAPGKVGDPVQRARNLLYVAAVPDVIQTPIERFAPLVVYERLQQDIPAAQLIQALFWIALHPMDGDDSAIDQLPILGLNYGGTDVEETRNRAAFYAVKLLGRLTGKIVPK